MKRVLTLTAAVAALVALVLVVAPGATAAGIDGTKHDFAADSWNTGGEICAPCHTPHGSNGATGAPLWDRVSTSATFTLYPSGGTIQGTLTQPSGATKLCLSCHDGTIGYEDFGGTTGGTTKMTSGDAGYIGTNLSTHHPVSISYEAGSDAGLNATTTSVTGITGVSTVADLLFSSKVECASCHDVHDDAGVSKLLRKSNSGSALCLDCHNK